jgi:hypothetical protein
MRDTEQAGRVRRRARARNLSVGSMYKIFCFVLLVPGVASDP